jgi:GT2 family glycosyltransferase
MREIFLDDDIRGFRCPSKAWNAVFDLIYEDHAFCISSDCVLGPHSINMAYHVAKSFPDCLIVGRADHSGPSYGSSISPRIEGNPVITSRVLTSAIHCNPIGFAWLLPMKQVRKIGGYDTAFMNGFCYEDNDFVARLWQAGTDIIFCDDIFALHMEHKRPHVGEKKKIAANERIFTERYGEKNYLSNLTDHGAFRWISEYVLSPGLGAICHEESVDFLNRLLRAQGSYGNKEDWRAIPQRAKNES